MFDCVICCSRFSIKGWVSLHPDPVLSAMLPAGRLLRPLPLSWNVRGGGCPYMFRPPTCEVPVACFGDGETLFTTSFVYVVVILCVLGDCCRGNWLEVPSVANLWP